MNESPGTHNTFSPASHGTPLPDGAQHGPPHSDPTHGLSGLLDATQQRLGARALRLADVTNEYVRAEPTKALLMAAAAGATVAALAGWLLRPRSRL